MRAEPGKSTRRLCGATSTVSLSRACGCSDAWSPPSSCDRGERLPQPVQPCHSPTSVTYHSRTLVLIFETSRAGFESTAPQSVATLKACFNDIPALVGLGARRLLRRDLVHIPIEHRAACGVTARPERDVIPTLTRSRRSTRLTSFRGSVWRTSQLARDSRHSGSRAGERLEYRPWESSERHRMNGPRSATVDPMATLATEPGPARADRFPSGC